MHPHRADCFAAGPPQPVSISSCIHGVCLLLALILPVPDAAAQSPMRRIGFLGMDSQMQGFRVEAFRQRMRDLGYVEGRNLIVDIRWAEGKFDRLPALAAELVAEDVEVLVTASPVALSAAQKATSTIPIVGVGNNAVDMGFIASLARPGGNVTGIDFQNASLSTKRLELLMSVVPNLKLLAIVWNRAGGGDAAVKTVDAAAAKVGVQTRIYEVLVADDLPRAVADAKAWGAQGLIQVASPVITFNRKLLIDALDKHGMPASCELRLYVDEGCLMTYSADLTAMFRDLADITVRVLGGAKPSELPMLQPLEFDFLVNLSTARKLGLTLSPAVRLQMTAGVR
jgi:putative ABC transport system substrate-binding protein